MSGLGGILVLDSAAPARADAASILLRLSHRADAGAFTRAIGPVVLGYCASDATASSKNRSQPVESRDGNVVVTFDGRLDNRDEIARACSVRDDGGADGLMVAAAYARWGLELPEHLLGSFALVIWDKREDRLLAARDAGGTRPLAYRLDAKRFAWASEPQALAEPPLRINEGYIAEHLAGRTTTVRETLYEGVFRLPMGCALAVTRSGDLRTWRYWMPACQPLPFKDEGECIEYGGELLRTAVAATLRDVQRATIALSSGIDSCAIAASAASVRTAGTSLRSLDAITVSFPGYAGDETGRAAEAARSVGVSWTGVDAAEVANDYFLADAARARDLPMPPNASSSLPLRDLVRERGGRVLLYGVGGDEWFFGSDGTLSDLIARGRWFAAARWLAAARRGPDAIPSRRMLWWGAWGATPDSVKGAVRRALGRPAIPPLIQASFANRTGLRDRLRAAEVVQLPTRAATVMFDDATSGDVVWRRDLAERICAWAGVEDRYPFADRRLIEFAFGIPDRMRYRDGRPKWILRQAFAAQLPPWMLDPPPGSDFSWFTVRRLEALGGVEALLRSQPVERGWIDRAEVRRLYQRMTDGRPTLAGLLWGIVAIDTWLTAVERTPPSIAGPAMALYDTPIHEEASASS